MTAQRTTKQQILDAIVDLHNAEQMVTREALQEVTGLKLTIIDDRVAVLVDEGSVLRKSGRIGQHAHAHVQVVRLSLCKRYGASPDVTVAVRGGVE